jgi:predicted ABC-type ATPase
MPVPKPTFYVIAGCNGAGKTTFAKEFLPSIGVIRFLNADEIARGLSPLKPEAVAFKAGKLLLSELGELIERRERFALEIHSQRENLRKDFQARAATRLHDRAALRLDS